MPNQAQHTDHGIRIHAMPAFAATSRWHQANLFVVTDRGHSQAGAAGDRANRQMLCCRRGLHLKLLELLDSMRGMYRDFES